MNILRRARYLRETKRRERKTFQFKYSNGLSDGEIKFQRNQTFSTREKLYKANFCIVLFLILEKKSRKKNAAREKFLIQVQ